MEIHLQWQDIWIITWIVPMIGNGDWKVTSWLPLSQIYHIIYRVVFLTGPSKNFLSTRKKQSIRTGPCRTGPSSIKNTEYRNWSYLKIQDNNFVVEKQMFFFLSRFWARTSSDTLTFFFLSHFLARTSFNTLTFSVSIYLPADT